MGYEDEPLPESRLFSTKTAVKKGGGDKFTFKGGNLI